MVDDFLGSGKTFVKYYSTYIKPQLNGFEKIVDTYALTLFTLQNASQVLRQKIPEVILLTEIKNRAFSPTGSVFGYRQKMLSVRDFCHRYGTNLFKVINPITHQSKDHPLGFDNSQGLIVFPYNPPNNTLPIIWSSNSVNGKEWIPLYPRSPLIKISIAKKVRKELAYHISLMKYTETGLEFRSGNEDMGWTTFHFITKTDFQAFGILFLKKQKRATPVICQLLGITEKDFYDKLSILKDKGILSESNQFTDYGESVYSEVLKAARKERRIKKLSPTNFEMKGISYLPKKFKGTVIAG